MSDVVAMRKLNAFFNAGVRSRIYYTFAVFVEAGLDEHAAIKALLKASTDAVAPKESKVLVEPLEAIASRSEDGDFQLSMALRDAFGAVSAEETAILSVLAQTEGPTRARLYERLAELTARAKGVV